MFENALNKKPILKVKWVKDNENDILNYENGVLISKANSKHLFIAFSLEYTRKVITFSSGKITFILTYLPVQLDALRNGYIFISMLCGDTKLASNLNIFAITKFEALLDFYGLLNKSLNKRFLWIKNCYHYHY